MSFSTFSGQVEQVGDTATLTSVKQEPRRPAHGAMCGPAVAGAGCTESEIALAGRSVAGPRLSCAGLRAPRAPRSASTSPSLQYHVTGTRCSVQTRVSRLGRTQAPGSGMHSPIGYRCKSKPLGHKRQSEPPKKTHKKKLGMQPCKLDTAFKRVRGTAHGKGGGRGWMSGVT